jgi:signal transduction histidine kinase
VTERVGVPESARLLALLDSLAAGVLVEDDDGRIELANPALVAIFQLGVRPAALVGARLADPPPTGADRAGWAALARVVADAAREGPTVDAAAERPAADAVPERPIDAAPEHPAADAEARPGQHESAAPGGRVVEAVCTGMAGAGSTGRLVVIHDVTASVAGRRALEEHNRRLAALSALKSEFIAIVSHELRTPLTTISAFTEMLTGHDDLAAADAPDAIAAIARNTDRMLILVQDLRLLSQLETGAHAVASGAVDLPELAREVGDGVDVGGRVVAVQLDLAEGPRLDGDERLLRQLMHAVVGTVASCTADDSLSLLAAADDTGWTVRATARTGQFVTDEQLLATPLPVLDDASRQRSAALSVLLARAIATSHGGTLRTEVLPGRTATITVRLPFDAAGGPATAPH